MPVGRCPGEAPGRQQRCSSVGMQPRCCNVCRLLRVHITHPRCPSRAAWRQRETRADYRFSRCAGGRVYVIPRAPPKPTHGPAPLLSAVGISAVCGRVGDPSRSAHYFPTTGAACITGGTRAERCAQPRDAAPPRSAPAGCGERDARRGGGVRAWQGAVRARERGFSGGKARLSMLALLHCFLVFPHSECKGDAFAPNCRWNP